MLDGKDEWYVSREGQRFGPVTYDQLKDAAMGGRLEPRSDMVYGGEMSDWKPACEVEGLFEKQTSTVSGPQSGHAPPDDSLADSGSFDFGGQPTDLHLPGAPRLGYILGISILPLLIALALAKFLPEAQEMAGETVGPFLPLLFLLVPLVAIIITVKRFNNLAMSGWWTLGLLVPILNLWLNYRLFACPPGYAYTRKMDGWGWFLAVIYWLLVIAPVVLFFIGGAEVLNDLIESGELEEMMEQIRGAAGAMSTGSEDQP